MEKAKDFKGSLKKLFTYLKPYNATIIVVTVIAAFSTVFAIVSPKIMAKATDALVSGLTSIVTGAGGGIDFGYIGKILLFNVGLYVISALFKFLEGYIMRNFHEVSYNSS